jgi:hypothetical protein
MSRDAARILLLNSVSPARRIGGICESRFRAAGADSTYIEQAGGKGGQTECRFRSTIKRYIYNA